MSYKKNKIQCNIFVNPSSSIIEVDEREFARRSAEGDKKSFEIIIKKYEMDIYKYTIWKVGDMEIARDITTEVFLKAFNGINRFKGESLKFWLMKIAANTVKDFLRKRKKEKILIIDSEHEQITSDYVHDSDMEKKVEQEEVRKLMFNVINKLSRKYSEIIILRYFMGMSIYELSNYLGISISTVRSRIFRAIRRLRMDKELRDFLED